MADLHLGRARPVRTVNCRPVCCGYPTVAPGRRQFLVPSSSRAVQGQTTFNEYGRHVGKARPNQRFTLVTDGHIELVVR